MKVKFNYDFKVDNTVYTRGQEPEITKPLFDVLKDLDIYGMPIITKEQTPLIAVLETKKDAKVQG